MQGYIPSMDGLSMSESHLYFVALTFRRVGCPVCQALHESVSPMIPRCEVPSAQTALPLLFVFLLKAHFSLRSVVHVSCQHLATKPVLLFLF